MAPCESHCKFEENRANNPVFFVFRHLQAFQPAYSLALAAAKYMHLYAPNGLPVLP